MNATMLRRGLGSYAIAGGAAGVLFMGWIGPGMVARSESGARLEVALVFLLIAGVFGLLIWAGVLILRRHPKGVRMFGLLQLLQIPIFGPSKWVFCAGPYIAPVWTTGGGKVLVGIKATFDADWAAHDPVTIIGVNLVPFVVLWLLHRLRSGERT